MNLHHADSGGTGAAWVNLDSNPSGAQEACLAQLRTQLWDFTNLGANGHSLP